MSDDSAILKPLASVQADRAAKDPWDRAAEIVAEIMTEVSAGRAFTFREVNSRLAAAKPAEALSVASDVDGLADRLLGALDMHDIGDLALLLRTATKPMLTAFCERLQQGLEQRQTTTVATCMLPQNNL